MVADAPELHVRESRFGTWFIHTWFWTHYVVEAAVADLARMIPEPRESFATIVDVGCGWGLELSLMERRFHPRRLVAIDIDAKMVDGARAEASRQGLTVEFQQTSASQIALSERSVDMIFCHQTFHHLVEQAAALREFYRVLKPGGVLMFAESTRKFIFSWPIRLLFRHPMESQRNAAEYIAMIRESGFSIDPSAISYPYLWWSRPDGGMLEYWFGIAPRRVREETLINLVAVKR